MNHQEFNHNFVHLSFLVFASAIITLIVFSGIGETASDAEDAAGMASEIPELQFGASKVVGLKNPATTGSSTPTISFWDQNLDVSRESSNLIYSSTRSPSHGPPLLKNLSRQYVKGQVIVKLKAGAPRDVLASIIKQKVGVKQIKPLFPKIHQQNLNTIKQKFPARAARISKQSRIPDLTNIYVVEVPPTANIDEIIKLYKMDSRVEYAQPNRLAGIQFVPNDYYYSSAGSWGQPFDDLWGLKKIQVEYAWNSTQGEGIVVAVIDTGLDYFHQDIASNVWKNLDEVQNNKIDDDKNGYIDDIRGWDFANNDNDPRDFNGHGTHVSGTIAAVGGNKIGIIGVAPKAKIMPVKGLGDDSYGQELWLANSIVYAAANGADVISNSWGGIGTSPLIKDAIDYAHGLGAIVLAAAGNYNGDVRTFFPANIEGVVTVSATDVNDSKSWFSNWGYLIDVAAPGGGPYRPPPDYEPDRNILSLLASNTNFPNLIVGNKFMRNMGTSMATPHVSGVTALVLAKNPNLTRDQVISIIKHTADDQVGNPAEDIFGWDKFHGWGRLNAARAVTAAFNPPPDPPILEVIPNQISLRFPSSKCSGNVIPLNTFNIGGGILNWSASAPFWVNLTPYSGVTPSVIDLSANADKDQQGVIRIESASPETVNSPKDVPIASYIAPTLKMINCNVIISKAFANQQWQPFYQSSPPGVSDGKGGAIYVWTDSRGPSIDLYVQRVDSTGTALWKPNGMQLTSDSSVEINPSIISDGSGGAIIAYEIGPNSADISGRGIKAQRISAQGELLWGPLGVLVSDAPNGQILPAIVSDGQEGVIISWADYRKQGEPDIYAQRLNSSGATLWTVNGVPVIQANGYQFDNAIASDQNGGAFVVWVDLRDFYNRKIYAQHLDAQGKILWPQDGIAISEKTEPSQFNLDQGPNILSDGEGGSFILWHDYRNFPPDPSGVTYVDRGDIYAMRINSKGQPLWQAGGIPIVTGLTVLAGRFEPWHQPSRVNMVADGKGGIIATWHDIRNNDYDIYAQRVNADGTLIWTKNGIPVVREEGLQIMPAIISNGKGGAIIAWLDMRYENPDIYVQHLDAEGHGLLGNGGVWIDWTPLYQLYLNLVSLENNKLLLTWDDHQNCRDFCYDTGIDMLGKIIQYSDFTTDNRPPILESIGNKTVNEGHLLSFKINASDPDGDVLTYSASPMPPGTAFDTMAHTFSWIPNFSQAGNYNVAFLVSDGKLQDEEIITITVIDASQTSLPDLSFQNVEVNKTKIGYSYRAIISNIGSNISGKWEFQVQGASKPPRLKSYASLKPGKSLLIKGKISKLPVTFAIDPKNKIKEFDENNNNLTINAVTTIIPASDLVAVPQEEGP